VDSDDDFDEISGDEDGEEDEEDEKSLLEEFKEKQQQMEFFKDRPQLILKPLSILPKDLPEYSKMMI
jgi:hypothetical protein